MTNRFLISVAAAALIAGTGFANAQGAGGIKNEGGAGSTSQQNAPQSGAGAAQHHESQQPGMKSGQSDKAPGAGKEAQDMKGGKDKEKSGTVGQAPEKAGAATKGQEKMGQEKMDRDDKMGQPGQKGATEPKGAQQNQAPTDSGRAQGTQTQGSQTTTGMAPAAPPPEKRSQITTAIKSEKIEDVGANVNVNVSIGTRLPDTVRFHPLPPRIVEIYPEWRSYEVVRIHGRYVIVKPDTREIVYIIEG